MAADNNNLAPSVGLTYSPTFTGGIGGFIFGEKKSVIRLGYNIGYDSFFNNIASNAASSSPNQIGVLTNSTETLTNSRGLNNFSSRFPTTAPAISPASPQTLIDPNLQNPYYQRYSLGFQRELPFNVIMDVSYVGSKGTNLFINEDANPLVRPELRITPAGVTMGLTGRLDNLQGARTVRTNGGDSNYHSGQLELRRRFADNFLFTGAYTFSKLINNADEVFGVGLGASNGSFSAIPAIFGGQANERALSVDDRTHRTSFTYVVESPFYRDQRGVLGKILGGFQLSGVTSFESGVPFTVTNGFDADGIGGNADRPTFNPNGQRGVRAVPVVEPATLPNPNGVPNATIPNPNFGAIIRYENPEIIVGFNPCNTPNCTPTPIFQTIDPRTAQFIVNPAFVAGATGSVIRVGDLGRNTERTPSVYNTNLTLLKRTRISETVSFEARTEFFNAFNQPNFPGTGLITSNANSLTQGFFLNPDTSNTSGGGREIRYQLKLVF